MKWMCLISSLILILTSSISIGQEIKISNEAVYLHQIPNSSGVFVVQAGSNNKAEVRVYSEIHSISLSQFGNDNIISSQVLADKTYGNILQFGGNNSSFQFINSPANNTSLQLDQIGDNLHFEMYGTNSISNKLEFNMTGTSRSLIVRNFK